MKPDKITFHCSDSPNGHPFTAADVRDWHIKRGWKDIGYHAVFCVDGAFQQGRPYDHMGAHVSGHNEGNLGAVFIGKDKFTLKQFEAAKWWTQTKMKEYGITPDKLYCHHEFDTAQKEGKTCPNMDLSRLKAFILNDVIEAIQPYLLAP